MIVDSLGDSYVNDNNEVEELFSKKDEEITNQSLRLSHLANNLLSRLNVNGKTEITIEITWDYRVAILIRESSD